MDLVSGEAVFEIDVESSKMAQILYASLLPETELAPSDRATTEISVKGSSIILKVSAGDLTALRAASNSFLSWISGCVRVIESVTGQKS